MCAVERCIAPRRRAVRSVRSQRIGGKRSVFLRVSNVTDDLPATVRLAAEYIEARLIVGLLLAVLGNNRSPCQAHDREGAGDDDLPDREVVTKRLRRVGQRVVQTGT